MATSIEEDAFTIRNSQLPGDEGDELFACCIAPNVLKSAAKGSVKSTKLLCRTRSAKDEENGEMPSITSASLRFTERTALLHICAIALAS